MEDTGYQFDAARRSPAEGDYTTKTRGFFGVPLGTGSEVRANIRRSTPFERCTGARLEPQKTLPHPAP
eukprot:scaffold45350_cov36-Phaeocystis_antarctica.AAC.2